MTEACLARAESADAGGVFITLTVERARREAAASAGRYRAGRPLGPLDGVPVAWKDVFDVAGTRTTAGSLTRSGVEAARHDAPCVANLSAAGMVCIGKTNLSEFAYSGVGINAVYGTPRNPRAAGRVPGGSSSGSAIAVALGAAACGIGTDTSGSVRIPAAFNGLVGYRPSMGRFSTTGVFPLSPTLDTVGPLACRVSDVVALDRALRGLSQAGSDFNPSARHERTLTVPQGELVDGAEPPVQYRFTEVLAELEAAGWDIQHRDVRSLDTAQTVMDELGTIVAAEAARIHRDLLSSPAPEGLDRRVWRRLEQGAAMPPAALARLRAEQLRLMRAVDRELDGALIFPTVRIQAPRLAELERDDELFATANQAILRSTMVTAFLGMPGIALPTGLDRDRLPASVLLSLPAGQDERLLALALELELDVRRPLESAVHGNHVLGTRR